MSDWSLNEILDLAILMEDQSIQLYTSAQDKVVTPGSREMLKALVVEEEGHKKKLLAAKEKAKFLEFSLTETIPNLEIVDKLEKGAISAEASYQEILIFAAKREKETHDMYVNLAKRYKGSGLENIFMMLAQEELKHKYLLEKEYDDHVLIWM